VILQIKWKGYEKLAFLQQYFALFREGYRYVHVHNGRRIGTRMRSIRWHHFQWPWTP